MPKRTLIIGDVHGCIDELGELLEVLSPSRKDRVLFIGDLINKGPNSLAVWQLYRDLGAEAILGNHELRMLQGRDRKAMRKGIYRDIKDEFGKHFKEFMRDIQEWPLFVEEPEFIAVHAGMVPGKKLEQSSADELCNIRTWDGRGRDLQNPDNRPWFECVQPDRKVVFGHWAALEGVFDRERVIGLDTGCVYGKQLSALVLPDMKVVSVTARKAYAQIG